MHPIVAVGCLVAERGKRRGNEPGEACFARGMKRFGDHESCLVGGAGRGLARRSALYAFCLARTLLRLAGSVGSPFLLRTTRDFVHGPTGDGRKRLLFQNVLIACGSLRAIVLLDEQPVIPLFSLPAMHPNE